MLHLLILLQALSSQSSLEEAVRAFAKGQERARAEILEAGGYSLPLLRQVREQDPGRIDDLAYDIKKAAAGPKPSGLLEALARKQNLDLGEVEFPVALDALSNGLPLTFDPALFRTHFQKKVMLRGKDRPRREFLESFCRQLDLDYGFCYDIVLVAAPGRLWPTTPLPRTNPLSLEETELAERQIARLNSDRAPERDEAHAILRKLGKGVIPLLKTGALGGDAERRARCQELIRQLSEVTPDTTFHVPAAERQTLQGADDNLRTQLKSLQVGFKVGDIVLDGAMRLLFGPNEISVQLAPVTREVRVTLDLQGLSCWTVISVATHCCGCDFLIKDGQIVIDSKAEIERRLRQGR